jgi:hypothetical protein
MSTDFQTATLSNATNPPADPADDPFADHLGVPCRSPARARTNAHYSKAVGGRQGPHLMRADIGHPAIGHGYGESTVHWHQGELWTAIGDYRSGGEVRLYNSRLHVLRRWTAAELGLVPGEGHRLYMAINAAGRMAIAYTDANDRLSYIAGFDLPDLTPAFGPVPLVNPFDADEPVEIDDFSFDVMNLIAVTPHGNFVIGDAVTTDLFTFSQANGGPIVEPHLRWAWPNVPAMTADIIAAQIVETISLRNIQAHSHGYKAAASYWVRWQSPDVTSTVAVDPLTSRFVVPYSPDSTVVKELHWLDATPGDPPTVTVARILDLTAILPPPANGGGLIDLITIGLDGLITFWMKYTGSDGRADYAAVAINADGTLKYFRQPGGFTLSDFDRYAHLPQPGQGRSDPAAGAF